MNDDERVALRRRREALRRERERDAACIAYRVALDERGTALTTLSVSSR